MYPALSRRLSLNIKNISTASMNYSQRYDPTDQYRYFLNCRGFCFPCFGYRQTEDERSDIILKKGATKRFYNTKISKTMQAKRKATKYDLKRVNKYIDPVANCCTLHISNFHSSIFQFLLVHPALIQFGLR